MGSELLGNMRPALSGARSGCAHHAARRMPVQNGFAGNFITRFRDDYLRNLFRTLKAGMP